MNSFTTKVNGHLNVSVGSYSIEVQNVYKNFFYTLVSNSSYSAQIIIFLFLYTHSCKWLLIIISLLYKVSIHILFTTKFNEIFTQNFSCYMCLKIIISIIFVEFPVIGCSECLYQMLE